MRVAVLSDIHANLAALQAVLAHLDGLAPDAVMVGGDVVNRGPQPRECLELVLDRAGRDNWSIIKGNHEEYVLRAAEGMGGLAPWEAKIMAHSRWTAEKIPDLLDQIEAWPDHVTLHAPDRSQLGCYHASRKGNRAGLYESMEEDELVRHTHPAPPALCVGHTHIPFVREVRGKMLVNSGSVGMPFDGDPRAAYALLEWHPEGWTAEIMRVPYDRGVTERAYHEQGYIPDGGPLTILILEELLRARPLVGQWHRLYEKAVAAGKITVEDSVAEMLNVPVRPKHP